MEHYRHSWMCMAPQWHFTFNFQLINSGKYIFVS